MEEENKEKETSPVEKSTSGRPVPPFAVAAVRAIARQALCQKKSNSEIKYTKGITMKAGNILSFAAGKVLSQIITEATEQAKKTEANTLTKSILIDVCLRTPKFRFAVSLLKAHETQPYIGPINELSRRLSYSIINREIPLAIPFEAPHPPGRTSSSTIIDEQTALYREQENVDKIFSVLSLSLSAYMNRVPSSFKINK